MEVIFWYLLVFLIGLQFYFIWQYFLPLLKPDRKPKKPPLPISVIVCVKNEARNLEKNLPFLLNQKYPVFEVLIMDDHSDDDTFEVVSAIGKTNSNLRYLKCSESIKDKVGKKWALAEAIESASYKHVLLTDADCRPSSLIWIEELTAHFSGKTAIILGIGQYNLSGKWHDSLLQYETLTTCITYLGMAAGGHPYMGVGRNLAYQKRLFNRNLMIDERSSSGDDDMFIQNVANSGNTAFCIDQRAQTFSNPPSTYKEWIRQKTRHYSTAPFYKTPVKIRLALLKGSFYLPNYLVILLLVANFYPLLILSIFLIRWFIWSIIFNKIKDKLGFKHPLYFLPCYEIYFSIFDLWIVIKNLKKKQRNWR